ncbi:MAG TPA: hypothetical protein VK027_10095 [Chitinophagaceae bacterium]|nr:hypothetical protein [Chitinophagaceae bacterium]
MFAFRKFLVRYRIPIGILFIALGIWSGIEVTWWLGWLPILIGILVILAHFMVGPVSLMQKYIEEGDVEGAQKLLKQVKHPKLLLKPIRSAYYMLNANFSTLNEDFDAAESDIRKGLEAGSTDKDFQGTAHLQLGAIAFRKGNLREAYSSLRTAIKAGLPDADSEATAYLQLSSICMQRRDFRGAKMYYKKATGVKAKNPEILDQLQEMKKYIARLPG